MKEKKKRSVMGNIIFIIKLACQWDSKIIGYFFLSTLVSASLPFISILTPKLLVDELMGASRLVLIAGILATSFILASILGYFKSYLEGAHGPRLMNISFSFTSLIKEKSLKMDYKLTEDPRVLNQIEVAQKAAFGSIDVIRRIFSIVASGVTFMGLAAIILTLHPLILLYLSLNVLLVFYLMSRAKKYEHDQKTEVADLNRKASYLYDLMYDFKYGKDIRLYGLDQWIVNKYRSTKDQEYKVLKRIKGKYLKANMLESIILLSREGLVFSYIIYQMLASEIGVGSFMMYLAAVTAYSVWMTNILDDLTFLNNHSLYISDYRDFIETDPGEADRTYLPLPLAEDYEVEFRQVSFKYPRSETYIIKDFNLKIQARKKLAIVGTNGAGKTTLVKLLAGLYEPDEGAVLLNGIDIRNFHREAYYKLISVVFQEINIFAFSLADNVTFKQGSPLDQAKINQCLQEVGLADKVASYDKGLATPLLKVLDKDGVEMSLGESQKLAMARALYKDGPLMILDEPTAALDAIAESRTYQQFNDMVEGKLAIFISHRLSSTKFCDEIIYMEAGKIYERGHHDNFMKAGGKYADMYRIQASYYREEEREAIG